mmetsp:Transcript_14100/g.20573  ORF Transcript_14100/g.20573 Transcript_14100/m.20573 type:complete len:81 (+) Transcript_14100:1109-1351(+)
MPSAFLFLIEEGEVFDVDCGFSMLLLDLDKGVADIMRPSSRRFGLGELKTASIIANDTKQNFLQINTSIGKEEIKNRPIR